MITRIPAFPLLVVILSGVSQAQPPNPQAPIAHVAPGTNDPLGRSSPQASIFQFLEAAHARDYSKAAHFLNLRSMSPTDRKAGPDLARQLEDLLDDTGFDIASLSHDPDGDQSDGLAPSLEHLAAFKVGGQSLDMQLEKVELKNGLRVWLVSAESVAVIPAVHKTLSETSFEKKLPQQLVIFEILDTPIWRWLALILIGIALWLLVSAVSLALVKLVHSRWLSPILQGPFRLVAVVIGFRAALEFAPPSAIARLFLERAAGLGFSIGIAWAIALLIDTAADHWHTHLDPRAQAISYSILPLGRQILKLTLYLVALLSVVSAWGFNISTILAGIGVGGIAVALAAQKTIENLFGGISVIGDRPVLVGDVCRFGHQTGTITHIGLRSTRIRTADRTIVSVPNAQFASMELENFSARDKILLHPMLNLSRDTTSEQLSQVLTSCREVLAKQPKIELGKLPVRFVGLGTYSLDVEINVYVMTADYDEFLAVQQECLLQLVQAVERAGTTLAVPWQQTVESKK